MSPRRLPIHLFPSRCSSAGARLSPAEWVRRLETQSCLYCGTDEHFVPTCPFKRPSSFVGVGTLVGLKYNCSSRPPLHATLLWSDQAKSLQVLIDSGADVSLMDVTLVYDLGIPTQPLSIPMGATALNERSTTGSLPSTYECWGTTTRRSNSCWLSRCRFPWYWDSLGSSDTIPTLTLLLVPLWAGASPATLIA